MANSLLKIKNKKILPVKFQLLSKLFINFLLNFHKLFSNKNGERSSIKHFSLNLLNNLVTPKYDKSLPKHLAYICVPYKKTI